MKTENISIEQIKPYKRNTKKHDQTQIDNVAKSIEKYGFVQPLVIDKDGVIVIGHCRFAAAKQLGMKEVPCVRVDDLTPDQVNALRIVDNKTNESPWDMDFLPDELLAVDLSGFDFDFEINFADAESEKEVVEDEPPEVDMKTDPGIKIGDIFLLGKNRLMCGDSTDEDMVAKLMDGNLADLLITDPPYNVAYEGKTKDKLTIQNDNMGDVQFREFLKDAFSSADSVMKPGAVFYIWHADSEGFNFRGACRDVGWKVRECLIWNKNSLVMGRQDYQWKHEPCLYGWKEGTHLWASDRKQTTVIDMDRPTRADIHPTMKPVKLFDYQIKNNTKEGDLVLDLFGGSGTTIIACEQNGRVGYSMELDPHYVAAIVQRWENLTGQKAVKL